MNMMEAFYGAMENTSAAPMTGHRYYRLNISQEALPGNSVSVFELQLRTVSGGASVATGGTASSPTGTYLGYSPGNAFDGNLTTIWYSSGSTPNWLLEYDFGVGMKYRIIEYSIYNGAGTNSYPTNWTLDYSDDGAAWTIADNRGTITMSPSTWYTYTVASPGP